MIKDEQKVRYLVRRLCELLEHARASRSEGCTALAEVMLRVFCQARFDEPVKVVSEMRRFADRLNVLADCGTPDEMDRLAKQLADGVRKN